LSSWLHWLRQLFFKLVFRGFPSSFGLGRQTTGFFSATASFGGDSFLDVHFGELELARWQVQGW